MIAASSLPALAADPMSLDYSWRGIRGCTEEQKSPAFVVRNAPEQTRFLVFALTDVEGHQSPGQFVNYPPDGEVRPGAVSFLPPCKPGGYRWTITATDRAGHLLTTADRERPFPAE